MDTIGQVLRWVWDNLGTISAIVAILSFLATSTAFLLSRRDARIKLVKRIPNYNFASFVDAARQGDQNPEIIRLFLRSGIATNLQDPEGRTALVEAVAARQVETVTTLVNRRWRIGRWWRFGRRWCDPNCVDKKRHSPLQTAIGAGHRDIYDVLLAAGATTNAPIRAAVLRQAVSNGRVAEVGIRIRALVEPKEIDIPGDDGRTALAIAVERPSFAIVHMLLAAHADPNIPHEGRTPLLIATRASLGAIAEELLRAAADADAGGPMGETPLILAAEGGNLGIVQSLLARDANTATPDKRGRTALMAAILGDYPPIIDRLRERTNAGEVEAALILAARAGDKAKVRECIAVAGANLNAQAAGGRSALHDAAREGHTDVGRLLIKSGRVNVDLADDEGKTAFALATEANATRFIALLRDAKADPRVKRADGSTVVMIAAASRHAGVVAEVLQAELTPEVLETARNDGYTPLMAAVETGDRAVAVQLLDAGANANAQTESGVSPLMIAITRRDQPMQALLRARHATAGEDEGQLLVEARRGNLQRVEELLDAGVPANLTGPRGTTPLLEAARGRHHEVVALLIAKEADVNHEGGGRTALEIAVRGGDLEIVQLLLPKANVNVRGRGGKTPLLIACERFKETVLDAVLAARPDVDAADDHGRTPLLVALVTGRGDVEARLRNKGAAKGELEARLILAARRGDFAAVKALLAENPKFDTPGTAGETALLAASEHADADVVDALLEVGAEVNVRGTNGKTPLAMAAQRGSVVLVETLLAAGAKADLAGPDDRTPLAIAAAQGHLEAVQHLLLAKNNPNETDRFKYTALMLAAERGHTGVASELIAASATIDAQGPGKRTPLMFAAEAGYVPVLRLLLDKGAGVEVRDADDATALILACFAEKPATVAELVARGAEVDVRDKYKASPLLLAMLAGNETIEAELRGRGATAGEQEAKLIAAARHGDAGPVRMLLKNPGILVDARRRGDDTALIAAIANGHSHIARMLLDHGADVNIKGRGGRTALIAASIQSDLALIRALTEHGARATCEAMDQEWRTAVLATQDPAIRLHLRNACKALQPDDDVYVTSKGQRYHVGRCVHADRETSTLRAAVQNELRPCRDCITNQ